MLIYLETHNIKSVFLKELNKLVKKQRKIEKAIAQLAGGLKIT